MNKCRKNKYKTAAQEYRILIGEQSKLIKEQNEIIEKLQNEIQALKLFSINDYQFYLKEKKIYNIVLQELDRILTKFNC